MICKDYYYDDTLGVHEGVYVCGDDCLAIYDKQQAEKDNKEPMQELGKEILILPTAPKRKKSSKPRKPRDGLCVMCKTYLFDETLGDFYCCGDACVAEYQLKQKKKAEEEKKKAANAECTVAEDITAEGGVKRKRGEADAAETDADHASKQEIPRRTSGRARGPVNYAEDV